MNKISTLAESLHSEKEKNATLLSEIERQDQTLTRLDNCTRALEKEKQQVI